MYPRRYWSWGFSCRLCADCDAASVFLLRAVVVGAITTTTTTTTTIVVTTTTAVTEAVRGCCAYHFAGD